METQPTIYYYTVNVRDYFSDTKEMNAEQRGCYVDLIYKAWVSGGFLPNDDARLSQIAGVTKARWLKAIKPIMLTMFRVDERGWTNDKMLAELQLVHEKVAKNRASAAMGGRASALKAIETRQANATANAQANRKSLTVNQESLTNKQESKIPDSDSVTAREAGHPTAAALAEDRTGDAKQGGDMKPEEAKVVSVESPPSTYGHSPRFQAELKELQESYARQRRAGLPTPTHAAHPIVCRGYDDVPY